MKRDERMTKTEKILSDERYKQFEKERIIRLREKEQYSLAVSLEQYLKHLTRKFSELYLSFYHENNTALKKECVDLANLAMMVYLHVEGFRE